MRIKLAKCVALLLVLVMCLPAAGMAQQVESATWNGFEVTTDGLLAVEDTGDSISNAYAEKGESVTVKANFAYQGNETLAMSWSFYSWETDSYTQIASGTDTCTFTFEEEGNLMFTLTGSNGVLIDENLFLFEFKLAEETRLSVNETVGIWFTVDNIWVGEIAEYVRENFIRDWNGDGNIDMDELNQNVTVKWTSDFPLLEGTSMTFTEREGYLIEPGELVADLGIFTKEDDGKKVILTLENKSGDQFVAEYVFLHNGTTMNPLSATGNDEIQVTVSDYSSNAIVVEAKPGTELTFTDKTVYTGDDSVNYSYRWVFYNWETGEDVELSANGKECTIIMEDEGMLSCQLEITDSDGFWIADIYTFADIYKLLPQASAPVVFKPLTMPADNYGIITVTEGETVTIHTNASCADPEVEIEYYWSILTLDENGLLSEETLIDGAGASHSFVATMDHNGKKLCIGGHPANKDGMGEWLYYDLIVIPKPNEVYKTEYVSGIPSSAVTEDLKANSETNTPEKIEATMQIQVLAQAAGAGMEISADQTAVYDVKLMYSEDGGVTWIEATEENWPESGKITVTLPYPEGTGQYTHNFVVAHMFTTTTEDHKAGDIEYPAVTNTARGIQFQVSSLSPIAIAWEEKPEVPAVPATGDSSTPYLWMLGMLVAAVGCVMLVSKRRQNG